MNEKSLIYSWSFHHPNFRDFRKFPFDRFWNIVTDFETRYGYSPSLLSIHGKSYKNNTILDYSEGIQSLQRNRFQNVESLSIYTIESENLDFAFYWKLLFSISISKILGTHLYLGFALEDFPDRSRSLEELVKPAIGLLKPPYGYSYLAPIEEGVVGYSAGYIHTPNNEGLTEERKELITLWSNRKKLILEGKMRDLYLENMISPVHLEQKVDGLSLKTWIEADSRRGTLAEFIPDLFLWRVPVNFYPECRETLARDGLLIAHDRYVLPTELLSD